MLWNYTERGEMIIIIKKHLNDVHVDCDISTGVDE